MNTNLKLFLLLILILQCTVRCFQSNMIKTVQSRSYKKKITLLARPKSKWDNLVDEDDENDRESMFQRSVTRDMKYNPRVLERQNKNFVNIRNIGGKELTNDVYIKEPNSEVCWFVGKVARVSDVTIEQCIARQYSLIELHGACLRPIELYPFRGELDIWVAPGDSELDVAYNRPEILFTKMSPIDVPGAAEVKASSVGFQAENYDQSQGGMGGDMGFRTLRTDDGKPSKPEVQSPGTENNNDEYSEPIYKTPTEEELNYLQNQLNQQNIDIDVTKGENIDIDALKGEQNP